MDFFPAHLKKFRACSFLKITGPVLVHEKYFLAALKLCMFIEALCKLYLFVYRITGWWCKQWAWYVYGHGYGWYGNDKPDLICGLRVSNDFTRHQTRHLLPLRHIPPTWIILQLRHAPRNVDYCGLWLHPFTTPTLPILVGHLPLNDVYWFTRLCWLPSKPSHAPHNPK